VGVEGSADPPDVDSGEVGRRAPVLDRLHQGVNGTVKIIIAMLSVCQHTTSIFRRCQVPQSFSKLAANLYDLHKPVNWRDALFFEGEIFHLREGVGWAY